MKTRLGLGLLLTALLLSIFFNSCSTKGLSIEERVDHFISGLNGTDRSNVFKNFHPTETAAYNSIKDHLFWDAAFPLVSIPFAISITISGDSASGNISGGAGFSNSIGFIFRKDGDDWKIEELSLGGAPLVQ